MCFYSQQTAFAVISHFLSWEGVKASISRWEKVDVLLLSQIFEWDAYYDLTGLTCTIISLLLALLRSCSSSPKHKVTAGSGAGN